MSLCFSHVIFVMFDDGAKLFSYIFYFIVIARRKFSIFLSTLVNYGFLFESRYALPILSTFTLFESPIDTDEL